MRIFIAVLIMTGTLFAGDNLLENGDFSTGTLGAWKSQARGGGSKELHTVVDGRLHVAGDPANKYNASVALVQPLPTLSPTKHYRMSARVKMAIADGKGKGVSLTVRQADAKGSTLAYTGIELMPTSRDWFAPHYLLTPDPRAAAFYFYVTTCNLLAEDSVEVDDIRLEEVGGSPILHLVGDSTMAVYPDKSAPQEGWGMALEPLCKPNVLLVNHAVGGRSTKSFQNNGHWQQVLTQLNKGDYVVISMGINDNAPKETRPQNHTDTGGEFEGTLKRWIADVRGCGAIPVLATTTVLWHPNGFSSPNPSLAKYNEAMLGVAKECGVCVIDIHTPAFQRLASMKKEEFDRIYMSPRNDYCHLQREGAAFFARLFVQLCQEQKAPIAELFVQNP